ncbi:ATP-binding protein [Thermococcus sp. ES12]|uniref:ATP-binding protein n=1 Tax=Thermococcus sp. ES12 TaxID=1638246 RepID=UPI00143009D9|nr:ATP-binding protein [Thermococcus sp. ES12]NJE76475.1 ATP-binding protein [Thermococcus sp. ES12]
MNVEEILRALADQRETLNEKLLRENLIERELKDRILRNFAPTAHIITGPRRSGKSVLAFKLGEKALYVNFEDPAMAGFSVGDYKKLLQAGYELLGEFDYVILDEVQEVEGWERMVSVLRENYPTVVTGSNARLLSREFSTYLTGRYLSYTLLPFSFREFLAYRGIVPDVKTTREEAMVKRALEEYLKRGGFPEALQFGREYLVNLYNDIITRDVIVRYGVRNVRELKEVAFYLFSNFAGRFTYSKTKNVLGIGNVETVKNYVEYLESAYLVFELPKFSFKPKEVLRGDKKVYAVDTGMINAVVPRVSENIGRLMENAVFLELLRVKHYLKPELELYHHRDTRGEVDFVVREGGKTELIQVTYASDGDEIARRELKSLFRAMELFGVKEGTLVTWAYSGELTRGSLCVRAVPLWRWLLKESVKLFNSNSDF